MPGWPRRWKKGEAGMKDGRWMRAGWVLAALLLAALPCSGQQIVREALASFSAATNAVEYSDRKSVV